MASQTHASGRPLRTRVTVHKRQNCKIEHLDFVMSRFSGKSWRDIETSRVRSRIYRSEGKVTEIYSTNTQETIF